MSIKSFKQFIDEASAADLTPNVDTDDETKSMEPKAKGEKDFKDDHAVEVTDRPDADKQDGSDDVKKTPARKGDK